MSKKILTVDSNRDLIIGLLGLAAIGAGFALWPRNKNGFEGQVVVITGGSRGLGFALAENLIQQGAKLALLARKTEELEIAALKLNLLSAKPDSVFTAVCDVTNADAFETALAETRARFGRIDVLIHNAGAISVAPFRTLTDRDFQKEIDLHLMAAISSVRLIRPYFRMNGREGGRILFISSIGGKIGVPHMSSYSASKFALGGFADAVRGELAQEKISLTAAYPGLMRTGSPKRATFKGDHEKEFVWFAASDNFPLLSMSAESAARKILAATFNRRAEILVGAPAKLAVLARAVAPELMLSTLNAVARLLPAGDSLTSKTGEESRSLFDSIDSLRPLHALEESAQLANNQKVN